MSFYPPYPVQPFAQAPQYPNPMQQMPQYPIPQAQQYPMPQAPQYPMPTVNPSQLALGQSPQQQAQQIIQGQADNRIERIEDFMRRLDMQLRGMQGNLAGPALRVRFPSEYRAGIIEYPDLVAHPFFWGAYEITEGAQGNLPFATAGGQASFVLNLDLIYSYIRRVHFFMFRSQAPNGDGAPNLVVGDWIPVSSKNVYVLGPTDQAQAFPFEFRLRSGSNVEQWQTQWIPSSVLERVDQEGYPLPVEYKAYNKDTITIEARPLRARFTGDTQDEIVRLFVGFSGYKMYQEKSA